MSMPLSATDPIGSACSESLLCWVRRRPGAPIVVCFPHAGGTPLSCMALARALPDEWAVATLALPGHDPDRPSVPIADARRLGARLALDCAKMLADEDAPVIFHGNSFGALLAFETALALERRDDGLAARLHLVASGFRSPARPPSDAPLHALPRKKLLIELRECFGPAGPEALLCVDDAMGAVQEAALRADLKACETYRLGDAPALRCAVTVIALTADRSLAMAELDAWRQVRAGPVRFLSLDADHFPWSSAPAPLAALLRELIAPGAAVAVFPKSARTFAAFPPSGPPKSRHVHPAFRLVQEE